MGGGIRSNSDIFADRGDPWVSEKEGRTDYCRIAKTENPEFDRYFARQAPVKVEPKSETRKDKACDPAVRIANAMRKMHREAAKAAPSTIRRIEDDS